MKARVSAFRFTAHAGGAILLALLCAGCQLFGGDPAQENRDRLTARLDEFTQVPPREQLTEPPYIKGRALIVTIKNDPPSKLQEDPVYWGGPNQDKARALMAESPEQVETVVLLNYSKEKADSYQIVGEKGGVAGFREVCELVVIDRSIPAVVHRKTFRAPDLPSATSISDKQTDVTSSVSLDTVRSYIVNLPRR
ncbi:MAG: hypothetical protein LC795_07210 [Acidobacteria bacterium]|nr:hypothetical protein [Acidobacteriota bacterium]